MLSCIALFGRALVQFSRFGDQNPGRKKTEHANVPIQYITSRHSTVHLPLALTSTFPPALSITGIMLRAISLAPPTGYAPPYRKWLIRLACIKKHESLGAVPTKDNRIGVSYIQDITYQSLYGIRASTAQTFSPAVQARRITRVVGRA